MDEIVDGGWIYRGDLRSVGNDAPSRRKSCVSSAPIARIYARVIDLEKFGDPPDEDRQNRRVKRLFLFSFRVRRGASST